MFGIIATIIAARKGHTTFATVTGIWTGVAIILALSGYSAYAFAPGGIFFFIALGMSNLRNIAPEDSEKYVYFCPACGFAGEIEGTSENEPCPRCQARLVRKACTLRTWKSMSNNDRSFTIDQWKKATPVQNADDQEAISDSSVMTITDQPHLSTSASEQVVSVSADSPSQRPSVAICSKCGAELVEGAKFCRSCGEPVSQPAAAPYVDPLPEMSSPQSQVSKSIAGGNGIRFCNSCGNSLFPGQKFCNRCGKQIQAMVSDNVPELNPGKGAQATPQMMRLELSTLQPALRRAFIFIEDEEWDRAEQYLEEVLDQEPENAYAYLGKAMVAVKVGTPTLPTAEEMGALVSKKEYARAKRFADAELSSVLSAWEKNLEATL